MIGKRLAIWAGLLVMLPAVGCCRLCDRWCHDRHYGHGAAPVCYPAPVCPSGYAPVCCPAPSHYSPSTTANWQRAPQDCCRY